MERKRPVKEKNRAKGRETREASEEKGARQGHPHRKKVGSPSSLTEVRGIWMGLGVSVWLAISLSA